MKFKKFLIPFILILIGEGIFILPFLITRVFRPTFLKVFEINNFQLGSAFSVYGLVAMLSYFIGGPIADRFSPKHILFSSLLLTGLGGLLLVQVPSVSMLIALYGFWGATTILLFWAAFIKVTRLHWKDSSQGIGFWNCRFGQGSSGRIISQCSGINVSILFASKCRVCKFRRTISRHYGCNFYFLVASPYCLL